VTGRTVVEPGALAAFPGVSWPQDFIDEPLEEVTRKVKLSIRAALVRIGAGTGAMPVRWRGERT